MEGGSCVTLGELLGHSELHCLPPYNGNVLVTYLSRSYQSVGSHVATLTLVARS